MAGGDERFGTTAMCMPTHISTCQRFTSVHNTKYITTTIEEKRRPFFALRLLAATIAKPRLQTSPRSAQWKKRGLKSYFGFSNWVPSAPSAKGKSTYLNVRLWSPKDYEEKTVEDGFWEVRLGLAGTLLGFSVTPSARL